MQNEWNQINTEIQTISRVLAQTPDDNPNRRFFLICLAEAHNKRFILRHEPEDIQKVIEYKSAVLSLTPDDDPGMAYLLIEIGTAHCERFKRLGDKDGVEKAIEFNTLALVLTSEGHPALPQVLSNLAVCYRDRFEYLGEPGDIEKAIECDSRVVKITPKGHPSLPVLLDKLGTSHAYRFRQFGGLNDLEISIEYLSRALALTPNDHPNLAACLSNLSVSHKNRFRRLGVQKDLDQAIDYGTRALALAPDGHPYLPMFLGNLGVSHTNRFERLGILSDLEQAIEYESLALALTPDGHPHLPSHLTNLAKCHNNRFKRLDKLSDLEQAIEYELRALTLTPENHPRLSGCLGSLSELYSDRFEHRGELSDVDQAIKYGLRALTLTPDGHPDLPERLSNLAGPHAKRFPRLDMLSDLENAIKYESRALALTPDDHPRLVIHLVNLAVYYRYRFKRLSELSDVDQAIEYEFRVLDLTPCDHPDLPDRLVQLAMSHKDRFRHLDELSDLEQAIDYERRALNLTTEKGLPPSDCLAGLAVSHGFRYERLGEPSDLEQAIDYQTRSIALILDDRPFLTKQLGNLAAFHGQRFSLLGELSDLEKAIGHESRALALTPDDHPNLLAHLNNLATYYSRRFRSRGELSDLKQAIEYGSRALAADIARDHPDLCSYNYNHAVAYVDYYDYSHDPSYLQEALPLFRAASTLSTGRPRDRFEYARWWASLASNRNALDPIEACQATIDLLPQYIWLGATSDKRYQDLKLVQTLAIDVAHIAIISSNYSLALEWLEHARCVVWNQNIMLRSPLDPLQDSHPALTIRLQKVADELHTAGSNSRESQAFSRSTTSEQVAQDHRRLAKQYEELLAQARAQPGFEDFLRPMKTNRLTHAARNGPVVVINCHQDRCDALLVLPEQANVTAIPLPNFNMGKALAARSELEMSVESMRLRERGTERRPMTEAGRESQFESVLAALWGDIVKPVLDHLGYTQNVPTDKLPHITWCPTGPMTFLPLHAAGDYDQPHSRVFDYVISSYTPTLTALLEPTSYSPSRNSRVLTVGQAATRGHARLPGTVTELNCVKTHMQDKVKFTQLIDEQATVTAVLDQMEQHDWVHLACHAHQNVDDPKKSGFFLSDGVLDLDEINRRSLKGKGLAFLSACQTATGDKTLPDEAVHLASGMLMAGYSSVIATMWSVGDAEAPLVADKVYSRLMKEETLGNGEAGRALHYAVGELREMVGEKEFGSWVPFIHIGS